MPQGECGPPVDDIPSDGHRGNGDGEPPARADQRSPAPLMEGRIIEPADQPSLRPGGASHTTPIQRAPLSIDTSTPDSDHSDASIPPHPDPLDATAHVASARLAPDESTGGARTTRKRPRRKKIKKRTRATLTVASLNMRGRGTLAPLHPHNKWNGLHQIMKERRIGVLALQETHLTADLVEGLHSSYGRRIKILHSQDPDDVNARGVAFVLNREMTNIVDVVGQEIIPGRAMLLTLPWHDTLTLRILNVYAPNSPTDNEAFWTLLQTRWDSMSLPSPDMMLGDFNLVEDAIDRLPAHGDSGAATEALRNFKAAHLLQDGWRTVNPTSKAYTLLQSATGSQSRIDRIYATEELIRTATDWEITDSPVHTDHRIVSLRVVDQKAPFIGHGRWTMPLFLLKDAALMEHIHDIGMKLEKDIDANRLQRTATNNPQTAFKAFKDQIMAAAKARARVAVPKMEAKIRSLQAKLDVLLNEANGPEDEELILAATVMQQEVARLEKQRYLKARSVAAAHYRLEGETISRYWSQINKERTPRDVIFALKKPGTSPPEYETRSDGMALLARNYHDDLQKEGIHPVAAERDAATQEVLLTITATAPVTARARLAAQVDKNDVKIALKKSSNGSATGVNGLPYELWKLLHARHEEDARLERPAFDLTGILTWVYNDAEQHGVSPGTDFATGWVCPIYKKKDRRDVANYRPITLLNTDYKIFTKVLAMKLAEVAPTLIHENQAGFVPGRSIFDQVRLSKLMIDYAEATEENGVIVALDQEKAYDKIGHQYLWSTLRAFHLPDAFISTVRSLYENAESIVIVNGEKSTPFRISRGVRQGDPLSCLLFDLAIEPLACMLRQSVLHGFQIPGVVDKVITTLFADDTTTYLSEFDNFEDLQAILDKWCCASLARFNVDKTEIIPIGTPEYRAAVTATRRIRPDAEPFPPAIHIVKDQEAIRSLGAWIGNGIEQANPWGPVLEKITSALARWKQCGPTLRGKRYIVQMVVGGMSQYLAKVQGVPRRVEEALTKLTRNYIWDDKKVPPVRYDVLCQPIREGGIKLLDIATRNKAINLAWLRGFLDLSPTRPTWAYVADVLISKCVSCDSEKVSKLSQINLFLQTWRVGLHSQSKLPRDLLDMLRAARDSAVSFEAVKLSKNMKEKLPIWYHIGGRKQLNRLNNSMSSNCLRTSHSVTCVGDLLQLLKRERDTTINPRHLPRKNCRCQYCRNDRNALSCDNPAACCREAKRLLVLLQPKWHPDHIPPHDGLTLTTRRKARNVKARQENDRVLFDPSITLDGDLSRGFRAFTDPTTTQVTPAHRLGQGVIVDEEAATACTDGSCNNNGDYDARAGAGAWFGEDDPRNAAICLPAPHQSNQAGEIVGVLTAVQKTPPFAPLHIISDSKYVIDGLTVYLPQWEDRGWIGIANSALFRATAYRLRTRTAPTTFQWVRGHDGHAGNEQADVLAGQGANKPEPDVLDLYIDDKFNLTGARLATLTQALAYQGIRERKTIEPRPTTVHNLQLTRAAIGRFSGRSPTDATIWHSFRHIDLSRKITDFFWKTTHGAHKCGKYWKNIPGYEVRAQCPVCSEDESMEHILTKCSAPGQQLVWKLTEQLWRKKHNVWPLPSLGIILGCGLADFKNQEDAPLTGLNRLFRIVVSESAYLIWKLRCERRITREDDNARWHTQKEIRNRWINLINTRLHLDCVMTNRKKFGRKALKSQLVLRTWSGTLYREEDLPETWTDSPEVLVSIGQPE